MVQTLTEIAKENTQVSEELKGLCINKMGFDATAQALQQYGISICDATGKFRKLADILTELQDKWME